MSNSYTSIIREAIDLLQVISLEEYQKKLPPHFPSSIGAHMRHIVDHFLALIEGVSSGHVNYNVRHRYNDVEEFPSAAIENFEQITLWMDNLQDESLNQKVSVCIEVDAKLSLSTTCHSTLGRELVFTCSHAIHHYALIRIICSMQNKNIPDFFGYAPATISHISKTA